MYTLKIKITKEILEESKYCGFSASNCAVWLAIRDIFPSAFVYYDTIYFFGCKDMNAQISTPEPIEDFTHRFDNAGPDLRVNLPEQELELPIPDSVIDKINIDEIKPLLENHHCLELINS